MKKIVFIICLCFFGLIGNSRADTIFAEVHADTATIWLKEYHTHCGASFLPTVSIDGFHINLVENDTTFAAYCLCYYNLNTVIGGLQPGFYTVDLYDKYWPHYPLYPPADSSYIGSTSFTIEETSPPSIINILSNYLSDCSYYLETEELQLVDNPVHSIESISPNPVHSFVDITVSIPEQESVEIRLLDAKGKSVEIILQVRLVKGIHHVLWDAARLPAGLYVMHMTGKFGVSTRKMVVTGSY